MAPRRFLFISTACFALLIAGCATPQHAPTTQPIAASIDPQVHARPFDQAIGDGVKFLESSQNPDGSWGTGTVTRGFEVEASVPGSHDGFRVATTALAVMALRQAGEKTAHDKGLAYLINHGDARRATPDLLYNIWAHIYAVQCLSIESHGNTDPKLHQALLWQLDRMKRYQTYIGGWNYYDFEYKTQEPSMGPTSFATSAGLVALWEMKRAGVDPDPKFINLTLHRLEEMRLPDGAYLYGTDLQYLPQHPANWVRGSLGRSQAGNDALYLWGWKTVNTQAVHDGLVEFFKDHEFIEMGRKRQYPHEAWYYTAPYYYYFGHYYASRLLRDVNPLPDRAKFAKELQDIILPNQEPDGSWWDYAMWDYHKPYGTAFALMTLLNCRDAMTGH